MCAKLFQSCPALCNPMDSSLSLLSMELSRQEYWNGLPCPPPGDLPDPGIEPPSLTSQLIVGYKYLPLYNLCTLLKNFFRVHPRPILTQLGFALKFRCFFMTCVHACCAKLFQSCLTLCDPVDSRACQAPLSIGFSVKNTGMGCHALLQGIFLTQGSNSCLFHLLHWQTGS